MAIAVNVFSGWTNVLKETELSITLDIHGISILQHSESW